MTQEEALKFFWDTKKSKKFPIHIVAISYGIGDMQKFSSRLIVDTENHKMFFFEHGAYNPFLHAVLSIDQITKIKHGGPHSALMRKCLFINLKDVIEITYTSSKGNDVELLIGRAPMHYGKTFDELLTTLRNYVPESPDDSDANDEGYLVL